MKTIFTKDLPGKKIFVTREFAAPLEMTWTAWTDKDILDKWWAPKPWKAETKEMDFREGGRWLYCMVGPNGERHWARADYMKIIPHKFFHGKDSFCDENGTVFPQPPGMDWDVEFGKTASGTKVTVEITFASEKDLATIIEMGFEQGFTMAHGNLDEYFVAQTKTTH
ncbi:MAG TPA: SRPBCC domain-containing protein [Bacteroidia bacterium]|nr:SRPBCC domain-containing protein [Bacteroidia bacterium]